MQRLKETKGIKPGFQFRNSSMRLTVVLFNATNSGNAALLVRENDPRPYITVRDLSEAGNGRYDRAWGHYFSDFDKALEDYRKRLSDITE